MSLAPIALFVYNRPAHTLRTLQSLKQNHLADKSRLFVYCDGPKIGATEEQKRNIEEVRRIVRSETWCREVEIIVQPANQGLAKSITAGVSGLLEQYEHIIVLEDDLVTSPWFLTFMNAALLKYKNSPEVVCISGYMYPVKETLPDSFFIRAADCWGWATWKRGWEFFRPDGKRLLAELEQKKLSRDFDFESTYPFTRMLEEQVDGKNDSWAIRWYASAYLAGKLTLYPGKSLVRNIGTDGSGTHGASGADVGSYISEKEIILNDTTPSENPQVRSYIAGYFRTLRGDGKITWWKRIKKRLRF